MASPSWPRLLSIFPLAALLAGGAAASTIPPTAPVRTVDFRYAPTTWHNALGFPEDWHKAMTDDRGALLYDFGPGPYAQPLTVVEFDVAASGLTRSVQHWLDGPAPVLRTELADTGTARVTVTTLAVPPAVAAASDARFPAYERLDGIAGALGWATPSGPAAPEFCNVAWGVNRPLRYRVRVEPGASKRVVLGFCESYKPRLNERVADMRVEGAPAQVADLALTAPRHAPQLFVFAAGDTNRDGWIDLAVQAPPGRDPNTTLALIAVYPAGATFTRETLLASDKAELRIDCGAESLALPARTDLLHARFEGAAPVLRVRTGRALHLKSDHTLAYNDAPFIITQPQATTATFSGGRWTLEFPAGTTEVTAVVFSGKVTPETVAAMLPLSLDTELATARARWSAAPLPAMRVQVADPAIRTIIATSQRTVYQAREVINGHGQFDSSFSLYRGLWAGDVVYMIELAAMLGDSVRAREQIDTLFTFQNAQGLIDEMPPLRLNRTTAALLWAVDREARLSGDWSLARRQWPQIQRAVAGLAALRADTLRQPEQPYAGLLPPGFNDGGILEITAEYSSVYWTLTGLHAAAATARALGETAEATRIAGLAAAFHGSFAAALRRDLRRDAHGNAYLPVRVGFTGKDEIPQLAQWAVLEAHLFGNWLPLDGELLQGTLAMLRAVGKQGLPHSTGWLRGGIWAGYGSLYAHLPMLLGRDEEAADLIYAIANHASPTGGWVEEQSAVGDPVKLAGDQPHCWASGLFVRLAISCLAIERDDTLHLLSAIPVEWLRAGNINRLEGIRTAAGIVSLSVTVSADGGTATVSLEPIGSPRSAGKILLHTPSLRRAGFAAPPEPIELTPGKAFSFNFPRTATSVP